MASPRSFMSCFKRVFTENSLLLDWMPARVLPFYSLAMIRRFSDYNNGNARNFQRQECPANRCKERPPAERSLCRGQILCPVSLAGLLRLLPQAHGADLWPVYGNRTCLTIQPVH